MPFSYPDVVQAGLPANASHISTLRANIDSITPNVPLPYRYTFSWINIGPGALIQAKYLTEMREAIQRFWNFKSRGLLPGWSSGVTPGGASTGQPPTLIRASDITDLRRWLNQYQDNHAPRQQGIDTKSYDANNPARPIVLDTAVAGDANWNWVGDVRGLWNSPVHGRLRVRTVITAPGNGVGSLDLGDILSYNAAFERYGNAEIKVYALIGSEFYRRDPNIDPYVDLNASLNTAGTNAYIEGFSARAASLVFDPNLYFQNVTGYIIYNEPNVGGTVQPGNFAALLRRCRERMGPDVILYAGGLQVGPGYDPNPIIYLEAMYTWLMNHAPPGTGWPWSGVNFHFHHNNRSEVDIDDFFKGRGGDPGLLTLMKDRGDGGDVIIGEWGVTQQDFATSPGSLSELYGNLIAHDPTIMFFFAHQPVDDPVHPGTRTWGLRNEPLIILPVPGQSIQAFRLTSEAGADGAFYTAYDTLIGT
ncbi:MAG: hypothetical protein ACKVVP_20205 [Chloroflexota bacterium]